METKRNEIYQELERLKQVLGPVVDPYQEHVRRTSEWSETAENLYMIQQARKRLEDQEAELAKRLKALSDNVSSADDRFAYTCNTRKGSVDYDKIPQLFGVDLEHYRKATSLTWKLSMVKE